MQDFAPDGEIIEWGALALTRSAQPFTEAEQWALRLIVEMVARVLADKSKGLQILPLRIWHEMTKSAPKWMQVKTLPGRWLLGGSVSALLVLMLLPVPHSISATAVLKTESEAFVGAPFSGIIKSSTVGLGDQVAAGQPLLLMATEELTLERETRLAELAQANRDAEINRALAKLPEMQIAKSRAEEIKTQLVLLDVRIAAAQVTSPIQGVIVDGEPAKKLGQAISRGDMLVTIAQTKGLYVEAAVSERDLNLVQSGAMAQLTLLADPDQQFDMIVDRTIPSVRQEDAQNVFPVRMLASHPSADWWFPGMTGVVRIQTGYAPLIWVISRRLVDYVRLYFWI
jgi:multidrug efflux pump subunit AcrA (membrane-fusion protein)